MTETSESPNEDTPLLGPDAGNTDTRRQSADRWWSRNGYALPTAFLTALVIGLNGGYSMNVNTTYIGKDMNEMQKSVLIILLPIVFSAIVPPSVPFMRIYFSRRTSMATAASLMVLGFLGSGLPVCRPSLLLVALAQSLSTLGSGLLNLLTYLAIREETEGSGDYPKYRAFYMCFMTLGMASGALGGTALIEHLEGKSFTKYVRPWQFPFLLEFLFATLLLGVIKWTATLRQNGESASGSVGFGISETFLVILCTITLTGLCSTLTQFRVQVKFFITASVLMVISILAICIIKWLKKAPLLLFSARVAGSTQVLLLVLARAAMSFMVSTLTYRLPLYSQIRIMIGAGSDKHDAHPAVELLRQAGNSAAESADYNKIMLPAYYFGQLLGEFFAAAAIRRLGHASIPLVISLIAYCIFGLLFGFGDIGCFARASWIQRLASMPMVLTFLAGVANGSADNCFQSFLFEAVDKDDRPAAEALSSLASNICVAAALAFAPLRYESLLRTGLIDKYGEERGRQLADKALNNINAADNATLQYAKCGIEENILEADYVLLAGVTIAAVLLYTMARAGSALTGRG